MILVQRNEFVTNMRVRTIGTHRHAGADGGRARMGLLWGDWDAEDHESLCVPITGTQRPPYALLALSFERGSGRRRHGNQENADPGNHIGLLSGPALRSRAAGPPDLGRVGRALVTSKELQAHLDPSGFGGKGFLAILERSQDTAPQRRQVHAPACIQGGLDVRGAADNGRAVLKERTQGIVV